MRQAYRRVVGQVRQAITSQIGDLENGRNAHVVAFGDTSAVISMEMYDSEILMQFFKQRMNKRQAILLEDAFHAMRFDHHHAKSAQQVFVAFYQYLELAAFDIHLQKKIVIAIFPELVRYP